MCIIKISFKCEHCLKCHWMRFTLILLCVGYYGNRVASKWEIISIFCSPELRNAPQLLAKSEFEILDGMFVIVKLNSTCFDAHWMSQKTFGTFVPNYYHLVQAKQFVISTNTDTYRQTHAHTQQVPKKIDCTKSICFV